MTKEYDVTDEHKLAFNARTHELEVRFRKEGLNPRFVLNGLQMLIEGNRVKVFSDDDLLAEWKKFYKDIFKVSPGLSKIEIPKKQKGFDRLIILTEKITTRQVFEKYQELFMAEIFQNLAEDLDKVRDCRKGSYAIWMRDQTEPDLEYEWLSSQSLKLLKVNCITLKERMLAEMKYAQEAKPARRFDFKSNTLCSGSRLYNRLVPSVIGFAGPYIKWRRIDEGWNDLCTRKVITTTPAKDSPMEKETLEKLLENKDLPQSQKKQIQRALAGNKI
ncbi:hypothetical protein IID20_02545 [Patescibacteria group bacterium]|nr:hypothetical protein [Patescibacteria group bacterium]